MPSWDAKSEWRRAPVTSTNGHRRRECATSRGARCVARSPVPVRPLPPWPQASSIQSSTPSPRLYGARFWNTLSKFACRLKSRVWDGTRSAGHGSVYRAITSALLRHSAI